MERVSLGLKDVLYEAGGPIERVYFPVTGIAERYRGGRHAAEGYERLMG